MKFEQTIWFLAAALMLVVGCEPYQEDGPGLPQSPTAEVTWYFLPDTVDGVPGIDSNTVVFEAEPSEDVFMELWDFGNGKVSGNSVDTMVYYVEDTYAVSYQAHSAGGTYYESDSITIERTLELPCEGTIALLTGCDNPKTWKFSSVAGAVSVGPEPNSGQWFASTASGLAPFQTDDRWQLREDGSFYYLNGGGTQNPFEGYVETLMTVQPSTYSLELEGGIENKPFFTVGPLQTEDAVLCGWMGVWDSGYEGYTIMSITEDELVLSSKQQTGECALPQPDWGYFTLTFVKE